jgi:hypothetical protein
MIATVPVIGATVATPSHGSPSTSDRTTTASVVFPVRVVPRE